MEKFSHEVVMLPTIEASKLVLDNTGKLMISCATELDSYNTKGFQNQYLYIISKDPITKSGWCINKERKTIQYISDKVLEATRQNWNPIFATTDESIVSLFDFNERINKVLDTFLEIYVEEYNKGKPIKEIDYAGYYTNSVLTKMTYTREEVEKLIDSCWDDSAAKGGLDEDCLTLEQWKEQNL